MSAINKSIYCWWKLLKGGAAVIDDLKASGFETVIGWTIHVVGDGDLVFNDTTMVKDGVYNPTHDPSMAAWSAQLSSLKQGGSVKRLLFGVGAWPFEGKNHDFRAIRDLIRKHGTGPRSPLHRNFAALREALPALDGIDFDNEDYFDEADSAVAFALMLKDARYGQVTFCPFGSQRYWMDALAKIEAKAPGFVTTLNLQCYSGGAGNHPRRWIDAVAGVLHDRARARTIVQPGLPARNTERDAGGGLCPDAIRDRFAQWKDDGIRGGFLWRYDFIDQGRGRCDAEPTAAAYADAIASAL